jgi:ferredoxin-NADP reductase
MLDEKNIGIIVKKTSDHGLSHWMTHDIDIWDSVQLKWPVGHYTDNKTQQNYLFVSIWSGLSPNFGLFTHLVYEKQQYWTIVNIFAERFHEHVIPYVQEAFTEHKQEHIYNFLYLSQEKNLPKWFRKGYVQDWLEEAIELLGKKTSCFLCGKPEMIDDVRNKLEALWIAKQDITFEKY